MPEFIAQITMYAGGRPRYKVQNMETDEVHYADHIHVDGKVHFVDDEIFASGKVSILIDNKGVVSFGEGTGTEAK